MSRFDNDKYLPHEVFISYRRAHGWEFAFLLSSVLEKEGISSFYDQKVLPNYVGEQNIDWPEAIQYNIEHCEIFVIVISGKSLFYCGGRKEGKNWPDKDNMWDEFEKVLKYNKNCKRKEDEVVIVPILLKGYQVPEYDTLEDAKGHEEDGFWGKTPKQAKLFKQYYNEIIIKQAVPIDAENAYSVLKSIYLPKVLNIILKKHPEDEENYINPAYSHTEEWLEKDVEEGKRLEKQADNYIDDMKDVVCDKMAMFDQHYVLDVGCATGYQTIRLFEQYPSVKYILGVDNSKEWIKIANDRFAQDSDDKVIEFKTCDILKNEFDIILDKAVEKMGHKFNVVFISLVLMHICNPGDVIDTISSHMERGGVIVIHENDDDLFLSYIGSVIKSDKSNDIVTKFHKIFTDSKTSGNRFMGRQIYSLLNRDFEKIRIEHSFYPNLSGGWNDSSVESGFKMTDDLIDDELKDESSRISRWAKFKEYQIWLKENRKTVEKILRSKDYWSAVPCLIFSAVKK